MVAVTRWFISTLYGSYYERCSEGSEKKPYNPILGEEFFCCWDEKQYQKSINGKDTRTKPLDGRTGWQRMNLVVEQGTVVLSFRIKVRLSNYIFC